MVELKADLQALKPETQEALRGWLNKGEFSTLKLVAEAKVKQQLVIASNMGLLSQNHPGKAEPAAEALKKANRYQTFLDVLDEIVKEPIHSTVKLS